MICDFAKVQTCESIIMYHEKKVHEGKAFLLNNNTFSNRNRPSDYINVLNQTASLNQFVSKNKFFNCSINLPAFENISDEMFLKVAGEYLFEMGYSECPFVIYRHKDKDHHHIHIIATTVDFSGKKVSDYKDQYNSEKLSRDLERKYNLYIVEKKGLDRKRLSEINAARYSVSNAICKGFSQMGKRIDILKIIPYSFFFSIKSNPIDNNTLLRSLGHDKYNSLVGFLFDNKLFEDISKEKLIKLINQIPHNSRNEFEAGCKEKGIYIRAVYNKGKLSYVYGLKEDNFYIKDSKLPKKFSYNRLLTSEGKTFSFAEQRKFIQTLAIRTLKESHSFNDFRAKLEQRKIDVIVHENTSGIFGISYRATDIENPFIIKASSLDGVSYKDIIKSFEGRELKHENPQIADENHISTDIVSKVLSNVQPKGRKKKEEDDNTPRKKKKKKGRSL